MHARSRITRKIIRVFIWILLRLNKLNSLGAETMNGYYFDFVRSLTLFRMGQFGFLLECCLEYNHRAHRDYSITFGAWTSLLWMLFRIFSRNRNWTKSELNSFNKPALTLSNNRHKIRVNHSFITKKRTESDSIYYSNDLKTISKSYWFGFVMSLPWCGYFLFAWIFSDGENGENSFEIFFVSSPDEVTPTNLTTNVWKLW